MPPSELEPLAPTRDGGAPGPVGLDESLLGSKPAGTRAWGAWLAVGVPLVLGVTLLFGGATAVTVIALRGDAKPPAASSAGATAPGLPPAPADPSLRPDSEESAEDSEPVAPNRPLASPAGERVRPAEAGALLPITAARPIWGTQEALATVALFGDLECPHTRHALRTTARLQAELGATSRFVFYHCPEETHPHAREAARILAQATLRHGSDVAWRLLGEAAHSKAHATPEQFVRWLASASLPSAPSVLPDQAALEQLAEDITLATLLDVRATPTFFVNGARVEGAQPEDMLTRVVADESRAVRWLRAQGFSAEDAYARRVRKNLINVDDGAADRVCIPGDGAPSDGPRDALVTVVEFSDFECPHCREVQPVIREVLNRHRGSLRRVWRSFALPQHERARRVASFALAARAIGGDRAFWSLHDALFGSEVVPDDSELAALATKLGLDGEGVLAAAGDPRREGDLKIDEELAEKLELSGTPTFFVNGRRLSGAVPVQVLEHIVREEIAAAQRVVRRGTPAANFQDLLCAELPRAPR